MQYELMITISFRHKETEKFQKLVINFLLGNLFSNFGNL